MSAQQYQFQRNAPLNTANKVDMTYLKTNQAEGLVVMDASSKIDTNYIKTNVADGIMKLDANGKLDLTYVTTNAADSLVKLTGSTIDTGLLTTNAVDGVLLLDDSAKLADAQNYDICPLSGGKVDSSYLPDNLFSGVKFTSAWDPTNTTVDDPPTSNSNPVLFAAGDGFKSLAELNLTATPKVGDYYRCTVSGTYVNEVAGNTANSFVYNVGDWMLIETVTAGTGSDDGKFQITYQHIDTVENVIGIGATNHSGSNVMIIPSDVEAIPRQALFDASFPGTVVQVSDPLCDFKTVYDATLNGNKYVLTRGLSTATTVTADIYANIPIPHNFASFRDQTNLDAEALVVQTNYKTGSADPTQASVQLMGVWASRAGSNIVSGNAVLASTSNTYANSGSITSADVVGGTSVVEAGQSLKVHYRMTVTDASGAVAELCQTGFAYHSTL